MKNLIFVLACLLSLSLQGQEQKNNNEYLKYSKEACHLLKSSETNVCNVSINFKDNMLFNHRLIEYNSINSSAKDYLLENGFNKTVFVISTDINSSDLMINRVVQEIKSVYQALNLSETQIHLCFVNKEISELFADSLFYPHPPPPPPPPPYGEYDDDVGDDNPFMIVENMPALGDCRSMRGNERDQCTKSEIIRFVSKNTQYPSSVKNIGVQARVFVSFVVGKDGYVKDVKVLRSVEDSLDEEAFRVVSSLPKFEPGNHWGKNVSVQYTIPVRFTAQAPCNNQTSVTYQGYEYDIIEIGDQCWFAENCRYLPSVSPSSLGSYTNPYYYVYGYEGTDVAAAKATNNYATYGVLYNWPSVMTEGICPSGWHIPSDGEFTQLIDYVESLTPIYHRIHNHFGYNIKSTSGWKEKNGSNEHGFTGLPGGSCLPVAGGGFFAKTKYGHWWTATEGPGNVWSTSLNISGFDDVDMDYDSNRNYGYSARCVRD
jgi:TonB family protein